MSVIAYWRHKDIRYWGGSVGSPQTEPCVIRPRARLSEDELDYRIRAQYSEYFQDNPHDEIVEPEERKEGKWDGWQCHLSKGGRLKAPNSKPKGKQPQTVFFETHHH